MNQPVKPAIQYNTQSQVLTLSGPLTLAHYHSLRQELAALTASQLSVTELVGTHLTALDTAVVQLLCESLGARKVAELSQQSASLTADQQRILRTVSEALMDQPEAPKPAGGNWLDNLERLGRAMANFYAQCLLFLSFFGQTLVTLITTLPRPGRWRVTAMVVQVHQTGLNAAPIVALLTFLVGAVVAFLGATVLADFGAEIYTVDLVGFAFMRELGVLLAAILLAGRTASSFTAQIGAMKVNEELDALKVQGLSPIELLVLPRLLALLITLPLLTFIGTLFGILGGMTVSALALGISPGQFLGMLQEIPLSHFMLGMAKAPVFALIIALVGCLEGFKVANNARSVGEHTTSAVVQSIFLVILLDAIAALFYMEMGW